MGSVPPRTNCSCDITPNERNHGATDQPAGRLVIFQEGVEEPKEAGKQFSLTSIRTWDMAARPRLGEDVASDPIQFVQAKLVGRGHVLYCADVCKKNARTFPDCCSLHHVGDVQMTASLSLTDTVSPFYASCLISRKYTKHQCTITFS